MTETDVSRLRALATAFRDAIERADRTKLGITFDSFPQGSCGDASPLLGRFLKDQGFVEVTYVLGERGQVNVDWTSHAWLRVDGYIVDITADQFTDMDERVIVSVDSPWHGTFEAEDQHEGDYRIYDAATVANLGRIYAVILEALGDHRPPNRC